MGLYDKAILSLYKVGSSSAFQTPYLFARYGA